MQKAARTTEARTPDDPFEDHCWKDVIPADVIELYSNYRREVGVGPSPALVAIDLYELVYQGGAKPVPQVMKAYPNSCGEHAWAAIAPTKRLFAAARAAGLAVFYSTGDARPQSQPKNVRATRRQGVRVDPELYAIRPEFKPQPEDVVITKVRASAFFGTPLAAHLTQLGVRASSLRRKHLGLRARSAVDAIPRFHVTGRGMLLDRAPSRKGQPLRHAPQVRRRAPRRRGRRALERCGPGHDGAPRRRVAVITGGGHGTARLTRSDWRQKARRSSSPRSTRSPPRRSPRT